MFIHNELSPSYDLPTKDITGMRFYRTPYGVFLPSVTTVVNYGEKPWLDQWRKSLGKTKADKEQQRCSERGTSVHLMCERFLKNEDGSAIIQSQPRDHVKLFNQIKFAIKDRVQNIRLQEKVLWSEILGIAGRADLIAEYDGELSVIDFKTSNNLKQEDSIEHYFVQSTAYALMVEEMYGITINNIVVIITTERGLMPQVFKRSINEFVVPLQTKVTYFYEKEKHTILRINNE